MLQIIILFKSDNLSHLILAGNFGNIFLENLSHFYPHKLMLGSSVVVVVYFGILSF